MTITINLEPEKEARLRQKAARTGCPAEQIAYEFVIFGLLDDIALFMRISGQFVKLVELRMLNPVNQLVAIGANRSIVSIQNPREGAIIAIVLDE